MNLIVIGAGKVGYYLTKTLLEHGHHPTIIESDHARCSHAANDLDIPVICGDGTTLHALREAGYRPYYLYRQSRTVGNQENVGWAKPGREGLYNVYIMDETHTILGCGAGAVTKLKQFGTEYLERIFNYKFPYEYIDRFEEMLRRKEGIAAFYEQYMPSIR